MKLEFLSSSLADLEWAGRYYSDIFPQGRKNFRSSFRATKSLLKENPYIGKALEENEGIRQLTIVKTPYALIYRVTETHIEVIRVWDQRRDTPDMRLD